MRTLPGLAAALLTAGVASAQNDECATAMPAALGVTPFDTTTATLSPEVWPCGLGGGPDLWYTYTANTAPGTSLRIETCGSAYDTTLEVFTGACGSLETYLCNDDACPGFNSAIEIYEPAAGTDFTFRIGGYNGASGTGSLTITEIPTPSCGAPDMFEDNDDCPGAVPIGDGTYPGLGAHEADNDFFAVTVDAGATLTVDILFIDSVTDLDLYLWDPAVACDTNIVGTGATTGFLVRGYSATDNEQILYTNTTTSAQNLIVEVDVFTIAGCNDYELIVSGSSGSGSGNIGTNYCTAVPNSTGAQGMMSATGSTNAAANNLTLEASNLPTSQFGIFVTSMTQAFVPGAGGTSNGNLCLGGALGRFSQPSQILNTGSTGSFDLVVDTTMVPQGSGFVTIMAGDTWNFQAWHRDPVGVGSNFTDGLEIAFN